MAVDSESITLSSLPQVLLRDSDKQAAPSSVPYSDKEWDECKQHFCRHCNTPWSDIESPASPIAGSARSLPLKQRFLHSCSRYRWWYGALLCFIIVAIVVSSAVFRPHPLVGIYRNGAGLVALDRGDSSDVVDVFYQHASGQIRHGIWTDTTQTWSAGFVNVLGPNAPRPRQGTPLMALSYTIGNETTWRVIYVDSNNVLQESVGSTTTADFPTEWSPGMLGLGHFNASTSAHTGLSVCQNMLWTSDPLGINNGSLVLIYGGLDGMNHMLTHDIRDTAWKSNYTFQDSSSDSGVECTCRGSQFLDIWSINKNGDLVQHTFNSDLTSNNSVYSAGNWTSGVVYNSQSIQTPTSISAIKFTANSTSSKSPQWDVGSTFVYIETGGNMVNGVNVDTAYRTHSPVVNQTVQHVTGPAIISGSKIASVELVTSGQNPSAPEHGSEASKVFFQAADYPEGIIIMTGLFDGNANAFTSYQLEIGK